MKRHLLLLIIVSLTVLGRSSLTAAEPAPIFRPVVRDIQNQLEPGMVMRLPASLEILGVNGNITLYPILEPRAGEFRISLVSQPNCQGRFCQVGYIAALLQGNENPHLNLRSQGIPITLKPEVRGVYVYVDIRGASSVPYGLVIWEQDSFNFIVSLSYSPRLTLEQNKNKIIDVAASMANEPPIESAK